MHADCIIRAARVLGPGPGPGPGEGASTVAVRDHRIIAIGSDDLIGDWSGPATRVVSAEGGFLMAGFQDAHMHPALAGRALAQVYLHEATTADEYRAMIRSYADAHPKEPWVLGEGWAMQAFPGGRPTRSVIDEIVPDRPAAFECRDGHSTWVNTRALEIAGIDARTPDPDDGVIDREPDGCPSGLLHEGASSLVAGFMPPVTVPEWQEALLRAQAYLHSLGIIGWQDAKVDDDIAAAYVALDKSGALTARVVGALWWERERGAEQIAEMAERRSACSGSRFQATSVKLMLDGIPDTGTAAMTSPYFDMDGNLTDNTGISFIEPADLRGYVQNLDKAGFQCHFHAIGDLAVRSALDSVEYALAANGRSDLRHHIAHVQVVNPRDLPRFQPLRVVANVQPMWASYDGQMEEFCIPVLGQQRGAWQYPYRSFERLGVTLAGGSDWSDKTPNPLLAMEVAARRVDPGMRSKPPFTPAERLSLQSAIRMYTRGAAYVNHNDDITGMIGLGAAADFAVLDRDPFGVADCLVGDCKVVLTMVDGDVVYADPGSVTW